MMTSNFLEWTEAENVDEDTTRRFWRWLHEFSSNVDAGTSEAMFGHYYGLFQLYVAALHNLPPKE